MGKKLHNHHCFKDMINYLGEKLEDKTNDTLKRGCHAKGLFRTIRTKDLQTQFPWQHLPLLLRAGVDCSITITVTVTATVTSFEMPVVDWSSTHCTVLMGSLEASWHLEGLLKAQQSLVRLHQAGLGLYSC